MIGEIHGWEIPFSIHPLAFTFGSIVKKPWVANDLIVTREILFLAVLADHDAIDGAPATRALPCLKNLVDNCYGLEQ